MNNVDRLNCDKYNLAQDLVDFINQSPTMYNVANNIEKMLLENNFTKLDLKNKWKIEEKGKYFINVNSSSIFAFYIGGNNIEEYGFKIIGSHTDSPTFKIKPNPEIEVNNITKLNIEPYGGMIISTWFDRPLSIAGRVFIKDETCKYGIKEEVVDINKPLFIIPNLAIHMNPDTNSKQSYNKQNDVMPIVLSTSESISKGYIENLLKEYIGNCEILDFELFLYEFESGKLIGENDEYISCGRLDNLVSAYTSVRSLIESVNNKPETEGISMVSLFNSEEVGSLSRDGADSTQLLNILERIAISLGKDREDLLRSIENSFMISADLTHALHPNYIDKSDPTNKIEFRKGAVIKHNSNKSYATDSYSSSVYKSICIKNKIPFQEFVNRSDMRSGSTIGSIITSNLPIPVVDVGIPLLAMHSIRELCHIEDIKSYFNSMYYFLNNKI